MGGNRKEIRVRAARASALIVRLIKLLFRCVVAVTFTFSRFGGAVLERPVHEHLGPQNLETLFTANEPNERFAKRSPFSPFPMQATAKSARSHLNVLDSFALFN